MTDLIEEFWQQATGRPTMARRGWQNGFVWQIGPPRHQQECVCGRPIEVWMTVYHAQTAPVWAGAAVAVGWQTGTSGEVALARDAGAFWLVAGTEVEASRAMPVFAGVTPAGAAKQLARLDPINAPRFRVDVAETEPKFRGRPGDVDLRPLYHAAREFAQKAACGSRR